MHFLLKNGNYLFLSFKTYNLSLSSNFLALGGNYVDVYRPIFLNFLDKTLNLNNIKLTATAHTENITIGQIPLYRYKNL